MDRTFNFVNDHCTEINFALSFGAAIVKKVDSSKTESRNFYHIRLEKLPKATFVTKKLLETDRIG